MKMPPSTKRPTQITVRRRLSGLDCIIRSAELLAELIQEIAKDFVAHYAGIRKRLALGMKDCRRGLIDIVQATQRHVLLNGNVERAALYERANLGYFSGREHGGHRTVHVTVLLPLSLVLKQGLLDDLKFADLRRGAAVLRGHLRMRVHG